MTSRWVRQMQAILFITACVLALGCSGGAEGEPCQVDADCDGDLICGKEMGGIALRDTCQIEDTDVDADPVVGTMDAAVPDSGS